MLTTALAIVTSLPVLILSGGLGIGGPALAALGFVKDEWMPIAKWGGLLLLMLATFIFGYRVADERAADAATIARLQSLNVSLEEQLANVKAIEKIGTKQRQTLAADKAAAVALADTYKAQLALQSQQRPTTQPHGAIADACSIDDADLHFLGELRRHSRAKP